MRHLALVPACMLFLGLCAFGANQDKAGAGKSDKRELTPLYRFWDKKHNEHVYTYEGTEPLAWRQNPDFEKEVVVGYAVTIKEKDTARLFRAYCKDGRHYFYLVKPATANDIERIEDFLLYVWTKPGEGRVPVHACFLPDSKDMFFDSDLQKVKDYAEETLRGIGVRRKVLQKAFYLYQSADGGKPMEGKK